MLTEQFHAPLTKSPGRLERRNTDNKAHLREFGCDNLYIASELSNVGIKRDNTPGRLMAVDVGRGRQQRRSFVVVTYAASLVASRAECALKIA
jgi:hypothetical protein